MSDRQTVHVTWHIEDTIDCYESGTTEGHDWFTCPADWGSQRFINEIETKVLAHAREFGTNWDGTIDWSDIMVNVDLGPEIQSMPDPVGDIELHFNRESNWLPEDWDEEDEDGEPLHN